jgi:hypothetical protein
MTRVLARTGAKFSITQALMGRNAHPGKPPRSSPRCYPVKKIVQRTFAGFAMTRRLGDPAASRCFG